MFTAILIAIVVWIIVANVKKDKNPSTQKKAKPLSRLEAINSVAIGGVEVPEGDQKLLVYVYDGRPVQGVVGPVKLVIAPGTVSMTSIYTGTEWCDNCAVYAGGAPVGFMSGRHPADDLKTLANKHGHVVVHGNVAAPFRPNEWPIVTLNVPRKSWFNEEAERAKQRVAEQENLNSQRDALLWRLKAICNQKSRREYEERNYVSKQA